MAGVEHDPDCTAERLSWEVLRPLRTDATAVSVMACHTAPDGPEAAPIDRALRSVDVSDPLSEVESSVLLVIDTLDPEDRGVVPLGDVTTTLEAHEPSTAVESVVMVVWWWGSRDGHERMDGWRKE